MDIKFSSVPQRLRPTLVTRFKHVYHDFKKEGLVLTVLEKKWLFQEVTKRNIVREGKEEDQLFLKEGLISRYGLHCKFFRGTSFKNFLEFGDINLNGHHPSPILPHILEDIQRKIALEENGNHLTSNEIKKLVIKGIYDSSQLRHNPKPQNFLENGIGAPYFKKIVKQAGINLRFPGNIDQSQKNAREDVLLLYGWYLVLQATAGHLDGMRKYNMDATTHVFENLQEGCQVATIADEAMYKRLVLSGVDDDPDILPQVLPKRSRQQIKSLRVGCKLGFAIKLFLCINASGKVGDMILVVAVKGMGANDWHHEEIKGLSITNGIKEVGHMYFSKTRCGTKLMWKDIFTRCIIPFILAVRDFIPTYNNILDDPNETAQHDMLSFDNEDIIASNVYDPELLQTLRESHIECANLPPGTTPITQACDNLPTFKGTKKEVKRVRTNGIDVITGKDYIVKAIQQAFVNLKLAFPDLSVGSGHINNIIAGTLCLFHSYTKLHDPTVYIAAFKRLGQHCERNPKTGLTVDINVLMNKCYTHIEPAEVDYMEIVANRLITQYVIPEGRMSYENFLLENFIPGPTTINRDDAAPMRRSSQIMTSESCQARQAEWVRVHSPEYLDEKKQEAADAKILRQADAKIVKESAKKDKKDAKVQAAIALQNLNSAQLATHLTAERVAKAARLAVTRAKRKADADAEADRVNGARARQQARQQSGEPMAIETSEENDEEDDEEHDDDEEEEEED